MMNYCESLVDHKLLSMEEGLNLNVTLTQRK